MSKIILRKWTASCPNCCCSNSGCEIMPDGVSIMGMSAEEVFTKLSTLSFDVEVSEVYDAMIGSIECQKKYIDN